MPAHADELADFEDARTAFDEQRYDESVQRFEQLVGGELPAITNDLLILECRKYLGASYLFARRQDDAVRQFELLLTADPGYELDPLAFSSEVLAVFRAVRARREEAVAVEARERARREEEARQRAAEALVREQQRIEALVALAGEETIEQRNSRWIAMLPFGAGQFQNNNDTLGVTMAVSEGLLLAASAVSFVLHDSLRDEHPADADLPRARQLEGAFRVANWVTSGLFAAVVIGGIVDAQVRFIPTMRFHRRRRLPPELVEPTPEVVTRRSDDAYSPSPMRALAR